MKQIPDGGVDLVLTDPPYNIARENNFHTMGRAGIDFGEWDKEAMQWEVRGQYKGELLQNDVTLNVMFYFGDNRRRDIDAYLKILLDSMSGIVYEDDALITELHVYKEVDKENPRTVIQVL